ncbi:MAG: HAD family hydrolase [Bacillota bacterium]|nr:HAD family hydrolase [Bacillota bacterium]MDW7676604.1 HAD family hydrolase [Bacillota bacterium]
MKQWQHILFDLDGTLTDSKKGITRGVQHALAHFGIEVMDLNALEAYIGPPLLDSFMELHGMDEGQAREAILKYREYYTSKGILEHTVYEGIPELLLALKQKGRKLYLATSKPTDFAEKIIEEDGLTDLFEGIYGSYLDGRRTAKAEVIEAVLKEHGLLPDHTVMVGDRSHDVIGAKSHGLHFIGVLYGYGTRKELIDSGAEQVAENVAELKQFLLD